MKGSVFVCISLQTDFRQMRQCLLRVTNSHICPADTYFCNDVVQKASSVASADGRKTCRRVRVRHCSAEIMADVRSRESRISNFYNRRQRVSALLCCAEPCAAAFSKKKIHKADAVEGMCGMSGTMRIQHRRGNALYWNRFHFHSCYQHVYMAPPALVSPVCLSVSM